MALLPDGQVVCWGGDRFGQSRVPADLVVAAAIAAGDYHSVALRADGSVVCWGRSEAGQCSVPTDLRGVARISAGGSNTIVTLQDTVCPADLNGDGVIGASDLPVLLSAWGHSGSHAADLDADDAVGPADLAILLAAWGVCE
jgi:alpha-tubulin suppressor-like RCC1 family protein